MHTYPHTPHLEYEDSYLHLSKMALDVKLTKLMLRLTAHIENGDIHITPEERKKWNNMVSHEEYDEFVKALKKRLGGLEIDGEDPAGDDPDEWDENLFVTVRRLAIYLLKKGYLTKSLIIDLIKEMFGQDDLSEFLTKLVADATYVKIADLDAYIKKYIEDHKDGIDGLNGKNGTDGKDGLTPFIGSNGNWWIGTTDTGVKAAGSTKEGDGLTTLDVVNIIKNRLSLYHSTSLIQLTLDNAPIGRAVDDNVGGGGGDGLDEDLVKSLIDSAFDGLLGTIHTYYKKTSDANSPSLPTVNGSTVYPNDSSFSSTGWLDAVGSNPTGSEHLWMILTVELNGKYGAWTGPIDITGGEGGAGSDTTSIEYVFHLSDLEDPDQFSGDNDPRNWSGDDNFQTTKFRKGDWTDHPSGVTLDNRFEFMSYRLKTDDVWQSFSKAVIWSSYGVNGIDGDGVEYIFYAGTSIPTEDDTVNWPPIWNTKYDNFQDTEFIAPGSSWHDDPIDLSGSMGMKLWVSMRKKTVADGDTKAVWGAYSTPSLWSYTEMNVVSVGALAMSPSTVTIPVNTQTGYNYPLKVTITPIIWKGLEQLSGSLIGAFTCDGLYDGDTQVSWWDSSKYTINSSKTCTITLNGDEALFTQSESYTLRFTASSADGELVNAKGQVTVNFLRTKEGSDGTGWTLVLSTHTVKVPQANDGPRKPDTVTVKLLESNGDTTTTYTPTAPGDYSFTMSLDGNTATPLTSNISTSDFVASTYVSVRALKGNDVVGEDMILCIQDGVNGVTPDNGKDATSYWVTVNYANVTYDPNSDSSAGSFSVSGYKQEGSNTPTDAGISLTWSSDGGTFTDVPSNGVVPQATISSAKPKVCIIVRMYKDGITYASIVIPVSIKGTNGDKASTTTQLGSYLRVRTANDGLGVFRGGYTPITETTEATAKFAGLMPRDMIYWAEGEASSTEAIKLWGIYICNQDTSYSTWPDGTQIQQKAYWSQCDYTAYAAFNAIVAEYIRANSITARLIVVVDSKEQVVGGMTGLDAYSKSLNNASGISNADTIIWAGPLTNGNVASAPFTVDSSGNVKADSANITAKDLALSGVFYINQDLSLGTADNNFKTRWLLCTTKKCTITGSSLTYISGSELKTGTSFTTSYPALYQIVSINNSWYILESVIALKKQKIVYKSVNSYKYDSVSTASAGKNDTTHDIVSYLDTTLNTTDVVRIAFKSNASFKIHVDYSFDLMYMGLTTTCDGSLDVPAGETRIVTFSGYSLINAGLSSAYYGGGYDCEGPAELVDA